MIVLKALSSPTTEWPEQIFCKYLQLNEQNNIVNNE